jgi:hypothetical protein
MALNKRAQAIEEAVKRVLEDESVINSAGPYRYARSVNSAFEEIRALRERGVGFEKICKSFEIAGMLPENANLHSFRQAFLRETRRRKKKAEITKNRGASLKLKQDDRESDNDLVARLTGSTVNSGAGKSIVKRTDGGFEY